MSTGVATGTGSTPDSELVGDTPEPSAPRFTWARVAGAPFAGTASGRCMEGVIRRATFPRFKQPVYRVRYPLSIQ